MNITDAQFTRAVDTLSTFVAIPSVSHPDSEDYAEAHLQDAADFVQHEFEAIDFDVTQVSVNGSAPYVIAQKVQDAALPTLLLYAHYDVQPVDRDHWHTDPFEVAEIDGRLFGRGASDDKAGIIAIVTALRAYHEAGRPLPCNVKVLVEGEEEYGSDNMTRLLAAEADRLQAEALLILDGGNKGVDIGTIENSTRGVLTCELTVDTLEKPTHSGVGCLAPDPAQGLAQVICALGDPAHIPGFLDDATPLTEAEKTALSSSSVTAVEYAEEHGVHEGLRLRGDADISVYERIVMEPSFSVLNMDCGKAGGGNSIQGHARATVGFRLTPGQDAERIFAVVSEYISTLNVNGVVNFEIAGLHAPAWKADISGPFSTKFMEALGENYPTTAVMPTGGTLPLITDFEAAFPGIETIIAGIEDPKTAAHSHNESQDLNVLRRATDSLISWLDKVGA